MLLEPAEGLLGGVAEVRIVAASRWSATGELLRVLLPGAATAAGAQAGAGNMQASAPAAVRVAKTPTLAGAAVAHGASDGAEAGELGGTAGAADVAAGALGAATAAGDAPEPEAAATSARGRLGSEEPASAGAAPGAPRTAAAAEAVERSSSAGLAAEASGAARAATDAGAEGSPEAAHEVGRPGVDAPLSAEAPAAEPRPAAAAEAGERASLAHAGAEASNTARAAGEAGAAGLPEAAFELGKRGLVAPLFADVAAAGPRPAAVAVGGDRAGRPADASGDARAAGRAGTAGRSEGAAGAEGMAGLAARAGGAGRSDGGTCGADSEPTLLDSSGSARSELGADRPAPAAALCPGMPAAGAGAAVLAVQSRQPPTARSRLGRVRACRMHCGL